MSSLPKKNISDDDKNRISIEIGSISEELESDIYSSTNSQNFSEKNNKWSNFVDSFREMKRPEIDPNLSELDRIAQVTAKAPLQHRLKDRHLQMIAIGGAIGTALFVTSGRSLRTAGPAGILIGWGLTGTMIYSMVMALGELTVVFPVSGAFTTFATRFMDESFGFANNMNYMLQWLCMLPMEIVAASITVNYWGTPAKYRDGFVALFWLSVTLINLFGVKGYAEAEFVFSFIKVITVIGFIIMGIVLNCGGGPVGGYIGGRYWHAPYGAFVGDTASAQFKGVCSVFVTAALSFAGSELIGLAAAESKEPRKSVPKAAKQVFWRITLFYMLSLLMIGLLVPYNDSRLIGASSVDATASPFVIAIVTHGIKGLPHVVNVVILIAVLSVGNSAIYACSRTLCTLAEQNFLPKWFGYIDRKGRPLYSILFTSFFGLISFVAASKKEGEVFDWLIALSGLSSLFTWAGICICHIRFRSALKAQGRGLDELPFVAPLGVWGSYWGILMIVLMFIAQFYVSVAPIGEKPNAEAFFEGYISFPIVLVCYFGHKIYKRNWKLMIKPEDMDIDTGRREVDLDLLRQELAEERETLAAKPWYVRTFHFWC